MKTLALIFLPLILEISWLGMQLLENRKMPEAFINEVQAVPSYELKSTIAYNIFCCKTSIGQVEARAASTCF